MNILNKNKFFNYDTLRTKTDDPIPNLAVDDLPGRSVFESLGL